MPPLQICRRLKLGAGQRVEDAKFRQRHDVIEAVGDAPPVTPYRAHNANAPFASETGKVTFMIGRGAG